MSEVVKCTVKTVARYPYDRSQTFSVTVVWATVPTVECWRMIWRVSVMEAGLVETEYRSVRSEPPEMASQCASR